jgi:hypothetical protein
MLLNQSSGQYDWKLKKQENGISVYLSDVPGSDFKAVKVDCDLNGTYAKLIAALINVTQFNKWIYNTKSSSIIKQNNPLDFLYYSETKMPSPLSNRDAIIHLKINTDSLPGFLIISGSGEPDSLPKVSGLVRVSHYKANWKVTMPSEKTIRISYILEIDPGGGIPGWIANSFVYKGPYNTFSNLAELLNK